MNHSTYGNNRQQPGSGQRAPDDFARAVARWCVDHPGDWPRRHGACPVCCGAKCFGRAPGTGDPPRWACFDSDHEATAVGRAGNGCWAGDALDLAAHARGLTRAGVLRSDGYTSGEGTPRRPTLPPAPSLSPSDGIAAEWARLRPLPHALDLVRLDASGRALVRCYRAGGRLIGIRALADSIPAGWFGTTPEGARRLLAGAGQADLCMTPAEVLDALPQLAGDALVIVSAPSLARTVPAAAVRSPLAHLPERHRKSVERILAAFPGSSLESVEFGEGEVVYG